MIGADREPLLRVEGISKEFPTRKSWSGRPTGSVKAVDNVSFAIRHGETLGLVGESGCGKSTTARLILGLENLTRGEIHLDGKRISNLVPGRMRAHYRDLQVVFQDPYSSLNPRMTARENVAEPLRNFSLLDREQLDDRLLELFRLVGLRPDQMSRFPHEFSGGQRQRIGIARALAIRPKLVICDEAVSALDVSVQAQVINLLMDLKSELGISLLFVAHDLAVVEHICDRVAVMYLGEIVEIGDRSQIYNKTLHPYTQALIAAAPKPDPSVNQDVPLIDGEIPSPLNPPAGCKFHTRCPIAVSRCATERPVLRETGPGHAVSCHLRG